MLITELDTGHADKGLTETATAAGRACPRSLAGLVFLDSLFLPHNDGLILIVRESQESGVD